ncbi:ankyrin repeat-containing domain protein [Mycena rebaudengoi]|nr:ankyrin repeat-containing domain protein [Mycena rebaudengoi]
MDYFEQLAPELILLLPPSLSNASLNSLILTCRRLQELLQPDLEARITPHLARQILLWAAASKPHTVKKLLNHTHPSAEYDSFCQTPLHVAAEAGNVEIATLLLKAGADPNAECGRDIIRPLRHAVQNRYFAMTALLLDYGAHVDACSGRGGLTSVLHMACSKGDLEMVDLLVARGAKLECEGHFGTALGFATHFRQLDLVRHLLANGADATVLVPLSPLTTAFRPPPHYGELLYVAMELRRPKLEFKRQIIYARQVPLSAWTGVPLQDAQKGIMALLLAHGASKDATIARISKHLKALAKEAERTEEDFMEAYHAMIKEAEDVVPDVLGTNTGG